MKKGKRKEAVEEVIEKIGVKIEIEEIRKMGNRLVEGRETTC